MQFNLPTKTLPKQLVEVAVNAKNASTSLPGDSFWVVYDREAPAKYRDELHALAEDKAAANHINIALSNVCFECWLLLHLINSAAPYSCHDDLIKNSSFKAEFLRVTGVEYEKSEGALFDKIKHLIPEARKRAKTINASSTAAANPGARPYQINPYFGILDLLNAIDAFNSKYSNRFI
ncbi:RloB family protein [Pseudovibrio sp. Tun.PSC04-5.I4]|uniref:RloB family protein n=1 Tax=Pseudovibrio sp. Tun.PSC04-5.I4 TaxID=1798213 RepID=UPI000B888C30|nr:RloB family protein [Pseudovibrio sp. Tun.PSC04-5.I4]